MGDSSNEEETQRKRVFVARRACLPAGRARDHRDAMAAPKSLMRVVASVHAHGKKA